MIGLCIEFKGHKSIHGYGKIKRGGKVHYAHRYFYEQKKGTIPEGLIVCHHCDNPACVNVDHLFLGTHKDNSDDKIAKGRAKNPDQAGEKNGNSKLSLADVIEIKKLIVYGFNNCQIARKYDLKHQTISNIRLKKSWANVTI